jgi:hypothetical protein
MVKIRFCNHNNYWLSEDLKHRRKKWLLVYKEFPPSAELPDRCVQNTKFVVDCKDETV